MTGLDAGVRDVVALKVARIGRVAETGDPLRPFVLLGEDGAEVPAVSEFLHHMLADDARPSSLRSYAYELLAWFRFLNAIEVTWDVAGRAEARDFALWLKTTKKPARPRRPDAPAPGSVNPLTGKATPGQTYAPRTRRHARAAIRSFYEYHREMHGRPLINPFPQAKGVEDGSLNAHHNPMQPFRQPSRRAAYQPKEPKPAPRSIPDQAFNELFAGLASNRDRALIAFWISTGARAAELLGVVQGLLAPEDQTIGVVRKGSQALQHLPASADAFVWLRLYQQSDGEGNFGRIGNASIDAKIDQTLSELDENAARDMANQVDAMIWREGFNLPLFQSPGDIAVRTSLANFGAPGLADVDYTAIGFMR